MRVPGLIVDRTGLKDNGRMRKANSSRKAEDDLLKDLVTLSI